MMKRCEWRLPPPSYVDPVCKKLKATYSMFDFSRRNIVKIKNGRSLSCGGGAMEEAKNGWCLVMNPSGFTKEMWGFCSDACKYGGLPGVAEELQEVDVTLMSSEECWKLRTGPFFNDTELCAGNFNVINEDNTATFTYDGKYFKKVATEEWASIGYRDTCAGDPGGPLFMLGDGGDWVQIGVTSRGIGCARFDS